MRSCLGFEKVDSQDTSAAQRLDIMRVRIDAPIP